MILLRSILFNICFYGLLVLLMILGLPTFVMGRRAVQSWARLWSRLSLILLDRICRLKLEFRGLDNLPKGAALIAPKHQSFFETFALMMALDDFTFVYKRELVFMPLFGWYLWGTGQMSIDRRKGSSALTQLVKAARRVFAEGRQLLIFPEGTRRPIGAEPAYKAGLALIQADSKIVCVPVALNSGVFWPRRRFRKYPGTIVIEFLEPIEPGLGKSRFMQVLAERIETATSRLVNEAFAKDPSLLKTVQADACL